MIYIAHYKISSDYENPEENLESSYTLEINATSLKQLHELLDEEDDNEDWDDSDCINWDATSELICTNRDLVKITDKEGKLIKSYE